MFVAFEIYKNSFHCPYRQEYDTETNNESFRMPLHSTQVFIGNSVTYLSLFFVDRCQNLSQTSFQTTNISWTQVWWYSLPGISSLKKTFHCSTAIKHHRKRLLLLLLLLSGCWKALRPRLAIWRFRPGGILCSLSCFTCRAVEQCTLNCPQQKKRTAPKITVKEDNLWWCVCKVVKRFL